MNAMRHITRRSFLAAVAVTAAIPGVGARAQNVVSDTDATRTVEPITVTDEQVEKLIATYPLFDGRYAKDDKEAARIAKKLNEHVREFLDGYPWAPFHMTHGISGYENYFDRPGEMYYALGVAAPYLEEKLAARVRKFLDAQVKEDPPFHPRDPLSGDRRRELYAVPDELDQPRARPMRNYFGPYAYWAYLRYGKPARERRIGFVRGLGIIRPWSYFPDPPRYDFDLKRTDYRRDEAQSLNGDLAGVLAYVRMARDADILDWEPQARALLKNLLQLRINLDRINPRILGPTQSTTGHLHIYKLARYCDLPPEVGLMLAETTDGLAAARLKAFREARPGWHMAFGDRYIGGENYTSPPHMSRAMFAAAAFIEKLPADELLRAVDIPWCKGDFYFIEKCVYALWASAGGPMHEASK